MAAYTVASCITRLQREFDDISQAIAEEYLSKADRLLAGRIWMRQSVEDLSSITVGPTSNGMALYALSVDTIIRVGAVEWLKSAAQTNKKTLTPTSIRKLDIKNRDWRSVPNSEPTHFYHATSSTGAMRLGFYPSPNVATSGGYPLARCHVSLSAALASGGSLPECLQTDNAHVWGAAWLYANDYRQKEEADQYEARFERAVRQEEEFLYSFEEYDTERLVYDFPVGGVV